MSLLAAPCVVALTVKVWLSRSGVVRKFVMYLLLTGSSQIVCQMPEAGEWNLESLAPYAVRCAPTICVVSSVGSSTRTVMVFSPALR